jgi:DNA-directed RNA polymerase subunit RPC12/RpoP
MSDIFFKCEACGHRLVVDESRRGMPMNCPDCHTAISAPTTLSVHQCFHCGQRLMIAPDMKGALVHCSACQEATRAPGVSSDRGVGDTTVVNVCPQCHASVNVSEEISNRPTPCPSCGEQVYFRDKLAPQGSASVRSPKPNGHDELRFRRRSR